MNFYIFLFYLCLKEKAGPGLGLAFCVKNKSMRLTKFWLANLKSLIIELKGSKL